MNIILFILHILIHAKIFKYQIASSLGSQIISKIQVYIYGTKFGKDDKI